jgi:hypothetical protein
VTRAAASHPLIGKWRIVEADLWDKAYLDMLEAAFIEFKHSGRGEVRFGCVVGELNCSYSATAADFTLQGHDEMDETSGEGIALFQDGGSLTVEFSFDNGDDAIFKAKKW